MPTVVVLPHETLCPDGAVLESEKGTLLCDLLLENGINIEHACEKACACTTCHVIIQEGFDSVNQSSETEDDLLDKAWGLTHYSRLSCQVEISENDLVIELPRYTINHSRENAP